VTAIEGHALLDAIEMGRRVAACLQAGGAQPALDHRRHRALAVGAGNVNRSVGALRIAQRGENRADVIEPELDAELFECEQALTRGHGAAS
jgi:hypothetical protein